MIIIACDFHPSFQQIAMLDQENGELSGRRLAHPAEAEAFYRSLKGPVRVGMEAIGNSLWFERLLAELGHELWWVMPLAFGPRRCVNRRPMPGMRPICCS